MNEQADQEGPTPDFIPGWFEARKGNPDPAMREAVRVPITGDHFPITFLRAIERVSPASDHPGFTVGPTPADRFDLAVVPGCWLVRDADLDLHVRTDEEFATTYTRSDRNWTPPTRRLRDNPHLPADYKRLIDTAEEILPGERGPRGCGPGDPGVPGPDAWEGTPPAEGTRRALIRDVLSGSSARLTNGAGGYLTNGSALRLADDVESALLQSTIDEEAMERGAEALTAGIEKVDVSYVRPAEDTRHRLIFDTILYSGLWADLPTEADGWYLLRARLASQVEAVVDRVDQLRYVSSSGESSVERFCEAQRKSHAGLQHTDPDFSEFHRGADTAFAEVLGLLTRRGGSEVTVSPIHTALDEAGIRRYDGYGTPQRRILTLQERIEVLLGSFAARQNTIDGLASTVDAQGKSRAEIVERCDQLLEQREEARAGEGHWKSQRDAALRLLQWAIPDLMQNPSDTLGADLAEFVAGWGERSEPDPEPGEVRETSEFHDIDDRPLWRVEVDRGLNHLRNALGRWIGL